MTSIAQWLERLLSKRIASLSIPRCGNFFLALLVIDQQSLCDTPLSGVRPSVVRPSSVNNYLLSLLLWDHTSEKLHNGIGLFPIWSSCACAILVLAPPQGEQEMGVVPKPCYRFSSQTTHARKIRMVSICSPCGLVVHVQFWSRPHPRGSGKWVWSWNLVIASPSRLHMLESW